MTFWKWAPRVPTTITRTGDLTLDLNLAMEVLLQRFGESHRARSVSIRGNARGERCIQGELLLAMGFTPHEIRRLTNSYEVTMFLANAYERTDFRLSLYRLEDALGYAQMMNDTGATWGSATRLLRRDFRLTA